VESGTKLSHYAVRQISDFTCPTGKDKLPVIIMLECEGNIRLGWLDSNYKIFCTSVVDITSTFHNSVVLSVDNMLFGDTIVCTLRTTAKDEVGGDEIPGTERTVNETASIVLRNYKKNGLIRRCIQTLQAEISSKLSAEVIARYAGMGEVLSVDSEWTDFSTALNIVLAGQPDEEQYGLRVAVIQALDALYEVRPIFHWEKLKYITLTLCATEATPHWR